MNVSLEQIFNAPLFKNGVVLAGREGMYRTVKRVSVFDAPFQEDVLEKGIIAPGDFFVTSLLQFDTKLEQIMEVIRILVKGSCSGLCIMTLGRVELITEDVRAYCDKVMFPIVCIQEDISYAEVLSTVNRYILQEQTNVLNQLKLDKILSSKTLPQERLKLLLSMNPGIREYVQAVYVRDDEKKEREYGPGLYGELSGDIYISTSGYEIYILSADTDKELERHLAVVCEHLLRNGGQPRIGIGRSYPRYKTERSLLEAGDALDMAQASGRTRQVYDPLSPQQLLLPIRGSREIQEFYDEFCREIRSKTSEEGMEEMLVTVRTYVRCNGDFKAAARELNQHENTIRYRINRLRTYLDVEEQPLLFHEIISLAVRIEGMLSSPVTDKGERNAGEAAYTRDKKES